MTPTTPSPAPTTPSPTPTHSSPPPAPVSHALSVAGAVAFGPGGVGTGDNPQNADRATDSLYSTGWRSDWYTTSALGNLKPGTGLLIDLGRRVTIDDAQLDLGGFSGADIQLRAGTTASPGDLHEVASANGASGRAHLEPEDPGPGQVPADLVHPAALGRQWHLPGRRLPRHRPRPLLTATRPAQQPGWRRDCAAA